MSYSHHLPSDPCLYPSISKLNCRKIKRQRIRGAELCHWDSYWPKCPNGICSFSSTHSYGHLIIIFANSKYGNIPYLNRSKGLLWDRDYSAVRLLLIQSNDQTRSSACQPSGRHGTSNQDFLYFLFHKKTANFCCIVVHQMQRSCNEQLTDKVLQIYVGSRF